MNGEGSYEHHERKVVYSVVSSAECKHVLSAIKEVDPKAFVNVIKTERYQVTSTKDTRIILIRTIKEDVTAWFASSSSFRIIST